MIDPKPTPTVEIAPGTYVVLECRCSGVRGMTTTNEVPVMIISPCAAHKPRQWAAHWVDNGALATPMLRDQERRLFARWRRHE